MPTKTPLEEFVYFAKVGSNGTATDYQPIAREPFREECLSYMEADIRATNEAYMIRRYTIEKVIFNGPATIVIWADGSKTVVKCMEGDIYDPEKALMMCVMEKMLGSKGNTKRFFKKWIPEYDFSELGESFCDLLSGLAESLGTIVKTLENETEKCDEGGREDV